MTPAAQARPSSIVYDRVVELVEHGQAGRGGERVPAERARLVHGTVGREHRHHIGPAAEGGQRQAATDDLAEARQVGRHAVVRLRAAGAETEAGDDLVEDQERAGRVARGAQSLEEAGHGATRPMFAATGSTITHATAASTTGTTL